MVSSVAKSALSAKEKPVKFINGQYNEITAKTIIDQKVKEYKNLNGKTPPARYILKNVYGITPSGRNKKYENALDELEYLTSISWRRNSSVGSLREQCYLKNGFLVIGSNLINLSSIKMAQFNDINLTLVVDVEIYDSWRDDDPFLKKAEGKLHSCDRPLLARIKNLLV